MLKQEYNMALNTIKEYEIIRMDDSIIKGVDYYIREDFMDKILDIQEKLL